MRKVILTLFFILTVSTVISFLPIFNVYQKVGVQDPLDGMFSGYSVKIEKGNFWQFLQQPKELKPPKDKKLQFTDLGTGNFLQEPNQISCLNHAAQQFGINFNKIDYFVIAHKKTWDQAKEFISSRDDCSSFVSQINSFDFENKDLIFFKTGGCEGSEVRPYKVFQEVDTVRIKVEKINEGSCSLPSFSKQDHLISVENIRGPHVIIDYH